MATTPIKLFISGPMTGLPNYNFDRFNEVEAEIRGGNPRIEIVNPVTICRRFKKELVLSDKRVFDAMIAEQQKEERTCNAILLLDGWQKSKGVRLELKTAIECGMDILLEGDIQIIPSSNSTY